MNANLKIGFWLAREAETYLEKTRYSHYFCNFIIIARILSHSSKTYIIFPRRAFNVTRQNFKTQILKFGFFHIKTNIWKTDIGFLVYRPFKNYLQWLKIETGQMVKKKSSDKVSKIFSGIFRIVSSSYE